MSSWAAAQQMLTRVRLAAQDAGHDMLATLDPVEASAELGSGRPVVLLDPPRTTWETWAVRVLAFEAVIVSPDRDALTAWPLLDQIADDLAGPLEIDSARLTLWQPATGDGWPCIHLTFDTTTTETE